VCGRIEHDHSIGFSKFRSHLLGQQGQQRTMVPPQGANETLQRLAILIVVVSDRLDVLVVQIGNQTCHVRLRQLSPQRRSQTSRKRLDKSPQPRLRVREQRGRDLALVHQLLVANRKISIHRQPPREDPFFTQRFANT
jgi:hypothetical protein